jgi:hypothetical protein
MDCRYLDEYYELCLLGTMSGDAAAAIREHVSNQCPHCLARLREAARTVYFLSQPARTVRPDPKRKAQLLRRLHKK